MSTPQPDTGREGGLTLSGVTVTVPDGRRRRILLDQLDLEVEPGEIVGITGTSGSGKSTLLSVAGLLREPDSGQIEIAGVTAGPLSARQRTTVRRESIGIVYQSANLLPALTAREQLMLVGHISRRPKAETGTRADRLIEALGLTGQSDQLPAVLSGGERQRIGIGRALMAEPDLLLADEPTASLDPERGAEVVELLAEQTRQRGLATLIVTHEEAPLRSTDRQLRLADGTLTEMTPAGA